MNKRIAWKNLPPAPARVLWAGLIVWLYLDRWKVPEWVIGGLAVLGGLLFAASMVAAFQSTSVDIFEEPRK